MIAAAAIGIVFVLAHISQHASSYSLLRDRPRIIQITNVYEVKQLDEITTIDVEGAGEIGRSRRNSTSMDYRGRD